MTGHVIKIYPDSSDASMCDPDSLTNVLAAQCHLLSTFAGGREVYHRLRMEKQREDRGRDSGRIEGWIEAYW